MNNLDFLNLNSLRNFPIKDGLGRVSDDGIFTIPNTLIVDLTLCSVGNDTLGLYISSISVSSTNLTIEISETIRGVFGTFHTALPLTGYNVDIVMNPSSNFPLARGIITIGSVEELASLPSGNFSFSLDNTGLLSRTYSPSSPGVTWLTFADNNGNIATVTGDIQINAHSNAQFRLNNGIVYLDCGEALGLNKVCPPASVPIITINGVTADSNGNFSLIPEQCVSLNTANYGLLISDNCGSPCLGCTEISQLAGQVNSLEDSIINIKQFTDNLQSVIDQATTLLNYQCACN